MASWEAPHFFPLSPYTINPPSSSSSPPHAFTPCFILNPREKKNPLQPPCCHSPKADAFINPVLWPCIPALAVLEVPSRQGQREGSLSPSPGLQQWHRNENLGSLAWCMGAGQPAWLVWRTRRAGMHNCWVQCPSAIWFLPYVMDWKCT